VVLLYERLLRDLDDAAAAFEAGGPVHEPLVHAQEIVAALEAALDPAAWAGANGMASLYGHLHGQLVAANLERDPARIAHCREVVAPLAAAWRDAWVELTSVGAP
jgi:flagellar protein FliS